MVQNYSVKATSPNKQKEKRKETRVAIGRLHIEGRVDGGPRLQRKHKDENEAKQNIRNTRKRRTEYFSGIVPLGKVRY